MSFRQFYCKALLALSLLFVHVFSPVVGSNAHFVEKRQIGVLARTGALPQGKRSVEVLARNGELPQIGGKKDADREDAQDLLIEELESLSKLRAQALADKIYEDGEKRSVAALARNGELPQKRLSIAMMRSGYLIRPPQETVQQTSDLLDPYDFLADDGPVIPEFSEERSFRTSKKSLGSARNFLLDSGINPYNKKNLDSLARDGGLASLKYPLLKQKRLDITYDLTDRHNENNKNVGASMAFDKKDIIRDCLNEGNNRRKWELFVGRLNCGELMESPVDGNFVEKRFLGRIPQLGRIHQKVQAPSARRRPHLRPNWL